MDENITIKEIITNGTSQYYSQNNWTDKDPAIKIMNLDPGKLELHLRNPENMVLVPVLVLVMFCVTVLLVVVFKQYPSVVSASAAAFLTFLGIFITLNALNEKKLKYA